MEGGEAGGEAGSWAWAAPRDRVALEADREARRRDHHPSCAQWAVSGECERNAAFMRGSCEASCVLVSRRRSEANASRAVAVDWYLFGAGDELKPKKIYRWKADG